MKTKPIFIALLSLASLPAYAGPFCVSHRGLGYGAMENSLEAFEAASKADAKAIEFDLRHTKDGKTIVYHDKKIDRLITGENCPKNDKISKLTFDEIRMNCRLLNGEVIPSFEEALSVMSQYNSTLFIEFKDTKLTESDINLIKHYYSDRPEKIVFISFKEEALLKIERLRKKDGIFKKMRTARLKLNGRLGCVDDFGGISTMGINKGRIKRLRKEGKLVGVFTKNSREDIEKYLKKGVDFITTNNSLLCESVLRSHQD